MPGPLRRWCDGLLLNGCVHVLGCVEQVAEMVSAPGWDASVRLTLALAKYENTYMATMEEVQSPPSSPLSPKKWEGRTGKGRQGQRRGM